MIRWRKLGRVYVAEQVSDWAWSHAFLPTTIQLADGSIRVFCAFLDRDGIGRVGYVDVDGADPTRVVGVSPLPVLDIGRPGRFDDNGVAPMSVCRLDDGRLLLYYNGWQLGVHVRYFMFAGVAVSVDDGRTFTRLLEVPVLDRGDGEAIARTGSHVRRTPEGWRMWYSGGSDWVQPKGAQARPVYSLRVVNSPDGVAWPSSGRVCLEPGPGEHGFGRAATIDEAGVLKMWYSIRRLDEGYTIGYGESPDGFEWTRLDHAAGIVPSDHGWDDEHISMASIEVTPHGTYMFYNGNRYGSTGFGVAVADV